jgi:hypothetical protein
MAEESKISDLVPESAQLLERAYQRGFAAGIEAAQAFLVRNLSDLAAKRTRPADSPQPSPRPTNGTGRSYGIVRPTVFQILREHPGATVSQIQSYARDLNASISPLSIGGEIRRMNGKFYRKRSKRWYLIEGAAGTAQQATPAAPNASQGEHHGRAPLATE